MLGRNNISSLLQSFTPWWATLGLLLVLAMGLSLRLEALADRYAQHPEGHDGSLEFKTYAESLLDYTLEGNKFPPKTRGHQPTLPLILTAPPKLLAASFSSTL